MDSSCFIFSGKKELASSNTGAVTLATKEEGRAMHVALSKLERAGRPLSQSHAIYSVVPHSVAVAKLTSRAETRDKIVSEAGLEKKEATPECGRYNTNNHGCQITARGPARGKRELLMIIFFQVIPNAIVKF